MPRLRGGDAGDRIIKKRITTSVFRTDDKLHPEALTIRAHLYHNNPKEKPGAKLTLQSFYNDKKGAEQ